MASPDGRVTRSALWLALRLVAARGFSVVTLLVAAFLLDVRAFATFGVYIALISLVWIAAFWRYENAIVAATREGQAGGVVRLCAALGAANWLVAAAAALGAIRAGWAPAGVALCFPAALAFRMALRIGYSAATRSGDLTGLGRVILVQAAVQAAALAAAVATVRDGALCLALADAAGFLAAAIYLLRRHAAMIVPALSAGWSRRGLRAAALRWRALPLFNLPGSLLSLGFMFTPLVVMPALADPMTAGAVALAFRLFDVPTQIITATLAPVLMGRFGPAGERFDLRLLAALAGGIAALYAAGAGALWAAIPFLGATSFARLGPVLGWVAAFHAGLALAAPLAEAGSLHRDQLRLALINLGGLAGAALASLVAGLSGAAAALAVFAAASLLRTGAIGAELRALTARARRPCPGAARPAA